MDAAPADFTDPAELADHREACDLCEACDPFRAFGACSTCHDDAEAIGPAELSPCCGSPVYFPGPVEDGPERFACFT
ncbi:hypothetical protein SEA_ZETA1847_39 [Microbacterium phage Zeta1847]|uniref:Uncharacterized protein n=1 Tax=Microbacterium phage Zeta1847 TaxID=2201444 RepID=A0A2Z4QAP2_9CAUD|nr:hypothetical protein HOT46_gp39 [Microbacterium phage Zeta1847]AWY06673.1 hypothetical protein SEA_ZETA1847_39 [Microbacterium phage Zeta1847]